MMEYEYKFLATKDDIERIRKTLSTKKGITSVKRSIQINYYYDTSTLYFQRQGTTIRVRQKEDNLKLQIKKKNYYGNNKNFESSNPCPKVQHIITVESQEVQLMGNLVTDRTRHHFVDGLIVDLDINYYNGFVDYEVEIELPDEKYDISMVNLVEGLKTSTEGKATRFYKSINLE